jgi:hypothetical protein
MVVVAQVIQKFSIGCWWQAIAMRKVDKLTFSTKDLTIHGFDQQTIILQSQQIMAVYKDQRVPHQ